MIILDTHIWVWWVSNDPKLSNEVKKIIEDHKSTGLGVSIISCWEVAKLHEKDRLKFSVTLKDWLEKATEYPGVQLIHLSLEIIVKSTQLGNFHNDPADQLIAATSIVLDKPLITMDSKLMTYDFIKKIP